MVALADWNRAPVLTKYLGKDVNAELQMGAVSGLADVESPKAGELLLAGIVDSPPGTASCALTAMTPHARRGPGSW